MPAAGLPRAALAYGSDMVRDPAGFDVVRDSAVDGVRISAVVGESASGVSVSAVVRAGAGGGCSVLHARGPSSGGPRAADGHVAGPSGDSVSRHQLPPAAVAAAAAAAALRPAATRLPVDDDAGGDGDRAGRTQAVGAGAVCRAAAGGAGRARGVRLTPSAVASHGRTEGDPIAQPRRRLRLISPTDRRTGLRRGGGGRRPLPVAATWPSRMPAGRLRGGSVPTAQEGLVGVARVAVRAALLAGSRSLRGSPGHHPSSLAGFASRRCADRHGAVDAAGRSGCRWSRSAVDLSGGRRFCPTRHGSDGDSHSWRHVGAAHRHGRVRRAVAGRAAALRRRLRSSYRDGGRRPRLRRPASLRP